MEMAADTHLPGSLSGNCTLMRRADD